VGFRRLPPTPQQPYSSETFLIPVEEVMLKERTLEEQYINSTSNGITEDFARWCLPLIGESLPDFPRF